MTAHTYHPDSHSHGLADDCPRCAEHAQDPFASLDIHNLRVLAYRVKHQLPGRSDTEARAMAVLKRTMERGEFARKLIGSP